MEKKINIQLIKFIVIESCLFITLAASFFFWTQPFFNVNATTGISAFSVTGYQLAFGYDIQVKLMTHPITISYIHFEPSLNAKLAFFLTITAIIFQLLVILCRFVKVIPKHTWHIPNLLAAASAFVASFLCIYGKSTFENVDDYNLKYLANQGSTITGIFILCTGIIMLLNTIEVFQKDKYIEL